MQIIAAMFDDRAHADDATERLLHSRCPRDAITFLPTQQVSEVASAGAYDWRQDKWGLWRGLAAFEMLTHPDRYSLAEGMSRGASVLLVAARNEDAAERYGAVLIEAGAIDLDERESAWREAGWAGYDGPPAASSNERPRSGRSRKVRYY